jgi:phosphatidylserine decarboxylase
MTDESSNRHFPVAKEVLEIFIPSIVIGFCLVAVNASLVKPNLFLWIAAGLFFLVGLFMLYFFRNPNLRVIHEHGTILSPAYGKVVSISETDENEYLRRKVTRVSIFLRIYDVHMNYAPVSGTLEYKKYHKGQFGIAGFDKASDLNEHMTLGVSGYDDRLSFKVIAGMFARRIVIPVKEGDAVFAGQRIGLIKFGSRADVFIPQEYEITVKMGDKVMGARTVIARRR